MRIPKMVLLLITLQIETVTAQRPLFRPSNGEARYTFTSTEESAVSRSMIVVDLVLRSFPTKPTIIELQAAQAGKDAAALAPLDLDGACRQEFGGDSTVLGRVVMNTGIDPHTSVPQCVPENLFGAVTDLIGFVLVRGPEFGIDQLRREGDSASFAGFEAKWARNSPRMQARVAASGGSIWLKALSPARAVVEWRPEPMEVTVARQAAPTKVVILHGLERFALELVIDPRNGELLGARATEDALDLTMWMKPGAELPELKPLATPGMPFKIRRTVQLVRRTLSVNDCQDRQYV